MYGWIISFIGYSVFLYFKYKDSNYPDSGKDYFLLIFAYSMITIIFSLIGLGVKAMAKKAKLKFGGMGLLKKEISCNFLYCIVLF